MRILLVTDSYPSAIDTINQAATADIVAGLRQHKHDLRVLTSQRERDDVGDSEDIHFALEAAVNWRSRVPVAIQFILQRKGRTDRNVACLQRLLATFRPEVVLWWNSNRWQRRLTWLVEQTPNTHSIYYVEDRSPLQPDDYTQYWTVFPHRGNRSALRRLLGRAALRQIRIENPGVLRMDHVICASADLRRKLGDEGVVPIDSVALAPAADILEELERELCRVSKQRHLGPSLPPARPQPLIDLKRWIARPINLAGNLYARLNDDEHLALAAQWMATAQDVTGNGGLAQLYDTVHRAWTPAYPETTGYAIPTLLHYAHQVHNDPLRDRVERMAQFLLSVQLADGAVPNVNNDMFKIVQPCAFDVGQVIYGYLAAYREFNHAGYLEAARRAGDWLVRRQESDGSWRRYTYHNVEHAWEVRVSWGLLHLAQITNDVRYEQAARANIAWTQSVQQPDGWFDHLALVPGEAAVMHSVAYCIEGLLECGAYLNDAAIIQSACRSAWALLQHQRADGSLPGAFAEGWHSVDHFTCLTGDAQMAIVWQRLYQLTGDQVYLSASEHLIDYLGRSQIVQTRNRNLLGSVPGSRPINGDYLPNSLPNWAVKFFMDALLLREAIQRNGREAIPPPR